MKNSEARQILIDYNTWRCGGEKLPPLTDITFALGLAIDSLATPKSSIAESIRNAAMNWPQYLGDVECEILHSFAKCDWRWYLYGGFGYEFEIQCRTFMLFVAEALE